MIKLRAILTVVLSSAAVPLAIHAQQEPEVIIQSLTPDSLVEFDEDTGLAVATNGVIVKYGNAVLTADRASVNQQTTEVVADGRVRIQQDDQVWVGEHVRYNFRTRQMEAEQFRTGRPPVFAAGEELRGDFSNQVYTARNAYVTTETHEHANTPLPIKITHLKSEDSALPVVIC